MCIRIYIMKFMRKVWCSSIYSLNIIHTHRPYDLMPVVVGGKILAWVQLPERRWERRKFESFVEKFPATPMWLTLCVKCLLCVIVIHIQKRKTFTDNFPGMTVSQNTFLYTAKLLCKNKTIYFKTCVWALRGWLRWRESIVYH